MSGETENRQKAFYVEDDIYVRPVRFDAIDYVFSPKYGYLYLDKKTGLAGGEGICYRTSGGMLCKIYFEKHMTYANYKKLQAMLEIEVDNPFIVWPKDILLFDGNFVGYVMDEITDTVSLDELRDIGFADYSGLGRLKIALNLIKDVAYLHSKKILVGDMKLDNILVKNKSEVYIIDTGSFQIGDYACNVYHREYTDKAYKGDELKTTLRTLEDEYFPINKILFETIMLKTPFYSDSNIEIDSEGSRDFNFPLDPNETRDLPPYMRIWFSLPRVLREYFYSYFHDNKIVLLDDWIVQLEKFINKQETAYEQRI